MTTRRLAAILAADMVGYSALMAADEAGTLARLKTLRRDVIDPEIARHGGEVVKLTGDGLLALFGSVVAAVEAAAAVQKAVASAEAATPAESRIVFRIGLHLGDVILDEGDIYGDGVNVAARLEARAEPGGVTLSDDAFRHVRGKTELTFIDLGELTLKNIPAPVRAHKVELGIAATNAFEALTGAKPKIPDEPSVAVMPFDNMSADPEQEYFADGITEDIITELSRFPDLMVIARNSTFSYKGRAIDLREVSRELGVRFVVEGSVRRAGNRVRVTAQLIDATTGSHLWAERYDRDLADIFEVQEEVTASVVASIAPQIERAEIKRARSGHDINVSSYDIALKARARMEDAFARGSADALFEAVEIAETALERDARCTHALRLQAVCLGYAWLLRWGASPERSLATAWERIGRFFEIERGDPAAWTTRGMLSHFRGDHETALADMRRAIEITPNRAASLFLLGWAESLEGLTDEAREHVQRGLRLSPRDTEYNLGAAYLALAQASFADGDFADTRKWGRLAVQMSPHAPIRRSLLIASCGFDGDIAEANEHRAFLASFSPGFLPSIMSGEMTLYQSPEHNARLVEGLRKAGVTR